jgi:hypothetical protein
MKGPQDSLIYFKGIASKDKKVFQEEVYSLEEIEYLNDLSSQCHRNAEIATIKFRWVTRAMITLYISITPWLFAIYFLYVSNS